MKKSTFHIIRALCAGCLMPAAGAAQNAVGVDFETDASYRAVGVYDTWENSPFRTGLLQGNAKVVSNPHPEVDADLGFAPNPTRRVLAVQRSRWGSNTFGARIDLPRTFELTPDTRYVHVYVFTPKAGRVMLVGLGKRTERRDQSAEAEQFWVFSTTRPVAGQWFDAVFPIKGAGGIDIHSLVVVPDCESPHALEADFAAYVDEVVVNNDPQPRFQRGNYVLNFAPDATRQRVWRYLRAVTLSGSADGTQTLKVDSTSPQRLYHAKLSHLFTARAGERLTPVFDFTQDWMNGYVYLDRNQDGRFSATLNADHTLPAGSDIMTYAYVETEPNARGYRSDGTQLKGMDRNVLNPPPFTLPADLTPGFYRMRFKVDWGSVDPAGNVDPDNSIDRNGGVIVDAMMDVHTDNVSVSSAGRNGDVLTAAGQKIDNLTLPYGKPFVIRMRPEVGFTHEGVRVTYGYNLSGDSLIHGNPQYYSVTYPASMFQNNELTLPAEVMRGGNVVIDGLFVELKAD